MNGHNRTTLANALKQIDPGKPYGPELFDALARLTLSVAIEAVCLRLNPATRLIEVYLVQRSQEETAYPGEWHCPGTVMRPGEETEDVFQRLSKKEFGAGFLKRQFVANVNHPTEARGHFFSLVYLCVLEEKGSLRGTWFPVDQLPDKTVESHRKRIIPVAIGAFVAESTSICL
jgi:ADP-ribose pyrophosphatase YjhB (NUDIX family)